MVLRNPAHYSEAAKVEIYEKVCHLVSNGATLQQALEYYEPDSRPSRSAFMHWVKNTPGWEDGLKEARRQAMDVWADEMIEIIDDSKKDRYVDAKGVERVDWEVVNRSRLRFEGRKWLMSVIAPHAYGGGEAQFSKQLIPVVNITLGGPPQKSIDTSPQAVDAEFVPVVRVESEAE